MALHDGNGPGATHLPDVTILPDAAATVAPLLGEVRRLLKSDAPVLGLATGNTFQPFFDGLVAAERDGSLPLASLTVTHLDEWVGYPAGAQGGMATEIQDRILTRLRHGVATFLGVPAEPVDEGAVNEDHEAALRRLGGVGLQLLGLGTNGHIAFNEPGTPLESRTHTTTLADETMAANAARFASPAAWPTHARTLGLATILESRRIVLVATGASKARAVAAMLEGPVSSDCPASVLRRHPDVHVLLDTAAAAELRSQSSEASH